MHGWSRAAPPEVPLPSQFFLLLQETVICVKPGLQLSLKMTVQNPIKAVRALESFKKKKSKRHLGVCELPEMPRAIACGLLVSPGRT